MNLGGMCFFRLSFIFRGFLFGVRLVWFEMWKMCVLMVMVGLLKVMFRIMLVVLCFILGSVFSFLWVWGIWLLNLLINFWERVMMFLVLLW